MWKKYITRRLAVQVAQAWNFGWGKAMQDVYSLSLMDTLVYRDKDKTEYYVDKKQYDDYIKGLYTLLKDERFIKHFHKEAKEVIERILKDVKGRLRADLSRLSNKELLDVYQNFILPNVEQFYIRMWTVFNIGEPLANTVREELKRYVPENEVEKYLLDLSSPLVPNDVLNERIGLLKIALLKKGGRKKIDFMIKKHTKEYMHIPMFDFDHEPYNEKHFMDELKSTDDPKDEVDEIKSLFAGREKKFNGMLGSLRPEKRFRNLLIFLKENVFLRDYRDMVRQKLNLELRRFYEEIGKRAGLDVRQIAILTNDEIIECLREDKRFPMSIIKERETAFLLIQKGKKAEIYSGQEAINAAERGLGLKSLKDVKEIKGITGSMGRAIGIVKIIYTNRDLHKVKKGDVLVATMTRQDFVPAMRKAVAIVTDEGSVTCHAAIIARELKLPCIVAADIATKVLKDGDKVEVDADKGIIRRI